MAKKIVDEQIKLSVVIDGNDAQNELHKLDKSTRELREANKTLQAEKQKLIRQGKTESEAYKTVTATIRENNRVIKENSNRTKELQNQIGITALTMQQLRSKATQLRIQLNNTIPGSTDYIRIQNDLKAVNARMSELNTKAKATSLTFGTVADGFNRYAAIGASIIAGATGVVISLQKIIDYNGKLSDSQADVMKTTGMTKKEVDELTKSFGLFKTRTSRADLLGIAEVGGRIGIAKEEIAEFVQVMNKAGVALGDSFEGGPEEVADKLGKIKGLYEEFNDASITTSFESIGSALNDLGADGMASERNVADFVTRVGSLPAAFKPSIATALGLGAAFEESGLKAEIAGTNYGKVISIASRDFVRFAEVMKRPADEVQRLLNTNPNEFFLQFADSLKTLNATDLSNVLDYLKLNDNEVKMVLGAAGKNVDLFREKIELANVSMGEASSMTDEYNIKNNNLAATIEKVKKRVIGLVSSEAMVNWLAGAFEWFGKLIGALDDSTGKFDRLRDRIFLLVKILTIVTVGFLSYRSAVLLTTLSIKSFEVAQKIIIALQNRGAVATGLLRSVTLLLSIAYNTVTGNVTRAAAATRLFNATLTANPLGLVLVAITSVVTALALFSKETDAVTLAQKKLTAIQTEVNTNIQREQDELNRLLKIARDEKRSKEEREAAMKKINQISPEYLGNIKLDEINTFKAKKAIDAYIDSLRRKMKMQALEKAMQATYDRETEIKNADKGEYTRWYDYVLNGVYDADTKAKERQNKELNKVIEERKALEAEWEKETKNNPSSIDDSGNSPTNDPLDLGGGKNNNKKTDAQRAAEREAERLKREHEQRLNEIKKYHDSALKLAREYEDGNYELMADGYDKEKQILQTQHERKIQDLKAQLIDTSEIEKAENQAKNQKLTEEQRKSYEELAKSWLANNQQIYRKVEQETDLHCLKLATTVEKYAKNEVDLLNEKYESEKRAREIAYNEQLILLGNNQRAREAAEKQFKDEEYRAEMAHLQELLQLYNDLINNNISNGVDFDLLTPEAEKKLQEDIEKVNLAMTALQAAKRGESVEKEAPLSNGEANLNLGQTDILGFTQEQWETFYQNIEDGTIGIETMTMAVQMLGNIWSQYGAMVEAGENRRLQQYETVSRKKEQRLNRQLNSGIITQEQYNKAVQAIEDDYARQKAELEYKQAKRKRKMDMANAFTSTALAVLNGLNTQPFFPLGLAMSVLAAGMGAFQIATIAKQPLPAPGFEQGFYGNHLVKRQQDGKIFNSTFGGKTKSGVVNKPTHFLTGENGPEMIIDSKAFRQMNPDLRNSLIRELRGIKGFENGYYNQDTMSYNVANSGNVPNGEFVVLLIRLTNLLDKIDREGIQAYVSNKDYPSMKNIKRGIQDFENFRNRNKVK